VYAGGRLDFHTWTDTHEDAQVIVNDLADAPMKNKTIVLVELTPDNVADDAFGEWLDQRLELLEDGPQDGVRILITHYGSRAQMLLWAKEVAA